MIKTIRWGLVVTSLIACSLPYGGELEAQANTTDCRVVGRVLDAEFGTPIIGASVWLQTSEAQDFLAGAATASDGVFSLDARPCGSVELTVEMLGYEAVTQSVAFGGTEETQTIEIRLERNPVEVEELMVEVPQSARLLETGFYARRAWEEATGRDYGQFYEPDEVRGRSVSYDNAIAMALAARIYFVYRGHASCSGPSIYVDGEPFRGRDPRDSNGDVPPLTAPTLGDAIRDIRTVNAQERGENYRSVATQWWMKTLVPFEDIEGMEMYRPVHGAIPDEFREANSNLCGAVLIWTKSGGAFERDYIETRLCESTPGSDGSTLGGSVIDQLTGIKLPGARVTLVIERTGGHLEEVDTLSDIEGRYRFCDLLALPVRVGARYTDQFGPQSAVPVIGDWNAIELSVPVLDQGSIAGQVVGVTDPASVVVGISGTSLTRALDAEGNFEFGGLPPRDYVVTLSRGGEVIEGVVLSVQADETTQVEFELP